MFGGFLIFFASTSDNIGQNDPTQNIARLKKEGTANRVSEVPPFY